MGESVIDLEAQEKAMQEETRAALPGRDFQIGYTSSGTILFVGGSPVLTDVEQDAVLAIINKYSLPANTKLPGRIIPMADGIAFEGMRYRDSEPYPQPGAQIIFGAPNPFGDGREWMKG